MLIVKVNKIPDNKELQLRMYLDNQIISTEVDGEVTTDKYTEEIVKETHTSGNSRLCFGDTCFRTEPPRQRYYICNCSKIEMYIYAEVSSVLKEIKEYQEFIGTLQILTTFKINNDLLYKYLRKDTTINIEVNPEGVSP